MTMRCFRLDADMANPVELETVHDGLRWTTALSAITGGTLTIQADDPEAANITKGSLIRFEVDRLDGGTQVIGTLLVEDDPTVAVGPGDEGGKRITLSGRNHGAEWGRATVWPFYDLPSHPRPTVRLFGFMDPSYPRLATWINVVATTTDTTGIGPPKRPDGLPTWHTDSPNEGAYPIWSRTSEGTVPKGFVPFVRPWTLGGAPGEVRRVKVWMAVDDAAEVWLDGLLLMREPGYYRGQVSQWEGLVTEGAHWLAIKAENQNPDGVGKGHLMMTVVVVDPDTGNLLMPAEINSDELDDGAGNTQWRTLDYPDPWPGMTAGEIIERLRVEAAARGDTPLSDWTVVGSGATDADGTTWTEIEEPVDIGRPLTDVLAQLAASVMEFAVDADSRTLRLWVTGGKGAVTAVTLEEGVNIAHDGLRHHEDGRIVNALLVRYAEGGLLAVTDAASIAAHGRWEEELRLESVRNPDEATRIAQAFLDAYREPRVVTTVDVEPTDATDQPFVAFTEGDWVNAPDRTGVSVSQRVMTLSAVGERAGVVRYQTELGNAASVRMAAFTRTLARMMRGTVGGRAEAASATPSTPPPARMDAWERFPHFENKSEPVATGLSLPHEVAIPTRIIEILAESTADGTGDTVVELQVDGNIVDTITIGAAVSEVRRDGAHFTPVQCDRGSKVRTNCTTAGGHTRVLVTPIGGR